MIKSLTNDICTIVDALVANKVLGYGSTYTPDLAHHYKFIHVANVDEVKRHGDCFVIEYKGSGHIEFTTHYYDYTIMCLIEYPEYQKWMRKHPETQVIDWTR